MFKKKPYLLRIQEGIFYAKGMQVDLKVPENVPKGAFSFKKQKKLLAGTKEDAVLSY